MGIFLFFIPIEFLTALIVIPLIVFSLIKKNMVLGTISGILISSGVACLFFQHTIDVKIMIWASGIVGLYLTEIFLKQE